MFLRHSGSRSGRQQCFQMGDEGTKCLPVQRGDGNSMIALAEHVSLARREPIAFVQHHDARNRIELV